MSTTSAIPTSVKLGYGAGQISEGIKNTAFNLFILYYYTQLLGLPGYLTGISLLIALLCDAITDPLVGSLSDRWRSKWGRRHPFMYLSIIPLVVSFYLLFAPPDGLETFELFLWLTFWGIFVRVALTLFHVPHLALGAEMSPHYTDRTLLVQFRLAMGLVGALLIAFLAFIVFLPGEDGLSQIDQYAPMSLTFAGIMGVTMLWCALSTHYLIPTLPKPSSVPETRRMTILTPLSDWAQALKNRSFRWYFSGVLIVYIMVGVDVTLGIHVGRYIWQFSSGQIFLLLVGMWFGSIIGSTFTRALHRRFDKKPIVMFGTTTWATLQVLPILLFLAGWLPEAGSNELFLVLVAFRFVQGMGTVQSLVTSGSMMADVADEHELETGVRREGVFFGALSFSAKATSGLGKFIAGWALTLIAWPLGDVKPGEVPEEQIFWLAMVYGPIVCGFAVIAVICYSQYRINSARHAEIVTALQARRESQDIETGQPG